MRLEIVEQSSKPVVITDEGVEVMGSVGPYLLGQALIDHSTGTIGSTRHECFGQGLGNILSACHC